MQWISTLVQKLSSAKRPRRETVYERSKKRRKRKEELKRERTAKRVQDVVCAERHTSFTAKTPNGSGKGGKPGKHGSRTGIL